MPRRRSLTCVAAALGALFVAQGTQALTAQSTHDESRLVVGVSGGWIGGAALWQVDQPVTAAAPRNDLFALDRELRSNITLAGQVTYFPSPTFGWTGEASYLGIGTRDQCSLIDPTGDFVNEQACYSINGDERSASGVALTGGGVWRPFSRALFQPYFKGLVGLSLVPRSTVELVAVWGVVGEGVLPIYTGNSTHQVRPTGALGFGIATAPRAGYQIRLEGRYTWVSLPVVTGPNPMENMPAQSKSQYIPLPSITLGIDVVLEKSRGRRY